MLQIVFGRFWVSRLVPRNNSLGLCKNVLQTCTTVSSDVSGCLDPFHMDIQAFSLKFLYHVQICIAAGDCFEISLTNTCCYVLFDCDQVYSNTQGIFSLPVKGTLDSGLPLSSVSVN